MWRVFRPDSILVWEDPVVREYLSWYRAVMENEMPAKFIICRSIQAEDLRGLSLDELWSLHEELAREFDEVFAKIRNGELGVNELDPAKPNFLDVKVEIANRIYERCEFCERRCCVNRREKLGVCSVDKTYVHSYFLHYGEEAPLVPSGTIFYGGCNFKCVFCQNYDISQEYPKDGVIVDGRKLALIQKELREEGARNINHVGGDPTPNLNTILDSLRYLDVNVPQLWNSNMYCSEETMKLLREVIDIWLPDFKYGRDECAKRLSYVDHYWDIVTRNLKWAHDWADIIIRHLVLPNHVECCTKPVLKWIASNCPRALVNIMEQYRPEYKVVRNPERWKDIARRPSEEEMRIAYEYARELGIEFEQVS